MILKAWLWNFFGIAILLVSLLAFQNCSSDVPFGNESKFSQLVNGSDFPYKVSFDQIAYMSCSEQENVFPDPQTFFTLRAGAYRNAGLGLSDHFVEETERFTDTNRAGVLSQNLLSVGSRLRFSLRRAENLQNFFRNETSSQFGDEGADFASIFTNLGDPSLSNQLLTMPENSNMNFWNEATFESEARLEGTMQFSASEILQNSLRNFLSTQGLLALNFVDEERNAPRGPGTLEEDVTDLRRNVFGMAVQLRFKQPIPTAFAGSNTQLFEGATPSIDMSTKLLASVEEVPLAGTTDFQELKSWTCDNDLAFRIVLPEHAVAQGCNRAPDPAPASPPTGRDIVLQAVRKSLYAEDWDIDLTNHCAIPKADRVRQGACYGLDSNTQETRVIQYDFSQPCGLTGTKGACAHFVSICVRND